VAAEGAQRKRVWQQKERNAKEYGSTKVDSPNLCNQKVYFLQFSDVPATNAHLQDVKHRGRHFPEFVDPTAEDVESHKGIEQQHHGKE
jgi:hypothetical protein